VTTRGAVAAVMLVVLCAADRATMARNAVAVRIGGIERDLCLTSCPAIPASATSDWLRSEEGQKANGCQMACRTDQPAAALYAELCDQAGRGVLSPETPLVKLAGKPGLDFSKRLQAAVKTAEGRKLAPLCSRARESFGARDENAFLDCMGRTARADGHAAVPPPDPANALRCSTLLAERDADWLKRCGALEARTDIDACVARAEEQAASRRQAAPNARVACESDAVERFIAVFRNRP
jgi:hypothetical protein